MPASRRALRAPREPLRDAADLLTPAMDDASRRSIDDAVERSAGGYARVLVIGEAKRGKSSLVNALFGETLLPTGALPLTSVATVVRAGPARSARVRDAGGGWRMAEPGLDRGGRRAGHGDGQPGQPARSRRRRADGAGRDAAAGNRDRRHPRDRLGARARHRRGTAQPPGARRRGPRRLGRPAGLGRRAGPARRRVHPTPPAPPCRVPARGGPGRAGAAAQAGLRDPRDRRRAGRDPAPGPALARDDARRWFGRCADELRDGLLRAADGALRGLGTELAEVRDRAAAVLGLELDTVSDVEAPAPFATPRFVDTVTPGWEELVTASIGRRLPHAWRRGRVRRRVETWAVDSGARPFGQARSALQGELERCCARVVAAIGRVWDAQLAGLAGGLDAARCSGDRSTDRGARRLEDLGRRLTDLDRAVELLGTD